MSLAGRSAYGSPSFGGQQACPREPGHWNTT
jgi:hypothetical protein